MAAGEERFWGLAQMTPGASMPTTATGDDDPVDNVVDTAGTPRNLVDLDQFSALITWED
jgi:hypothetical protein